MNNEEALFLLNEVIILSVPYWLEETLVPFT